MIKNILNKNNTKYKLGTSSKNFYVLLLGLFVSLFLSINLSFAQVDTRSVIIKLDPISPKVGDTFTATIESYSTDVDKADVSWILDKKVIKSGFGEKSVTLIMGKDFQNLLVKVTSPEGKNFVSGVSLLEKSVSIIWEGADSYVPDWYKGKKYVARGGVVRAVAIANISDGKSYIDNKDLVFTWEINGEIQDKISGLGKSFANINVVDEYGDNVEVSVTVKPRLTSDSISDRVNITPVDSSLMLYEKDNTYGLIKKVLGSDIKINKSVNQSKEIEIIAEPFYFSVDSLKLNDMKYVWSINGKQQPGNNFSRIFKLGDKSGSSIISVYAEHAKKLMQDSKREIKISF